MDVSKKFITENEAVQAFKVSQNTLRRFIEAGYLYTEETEQGNLLLIDELISIFGDASSEPNGLSNQVDPAYNNQSDTNTPLKDSKEHETQSMLNDQEENLPSEDHIDNSIEDNTESDNFEVSESDNQSTSNQSQIKESQIKKFEDNEDFKSVINSTEINKINDNYVIPTTEIIKFQKIITIQERMLQMKDNETEDLRSQRDWLQKRIEKLEEQTQQERAIMFTNTQTIKNIVDNKKSSFKTLLEFFGFAEKEK